MLSPRWKKVWADLWQDRTRTLLIVASIAVGTLAVGVIAGTFSLLPRSMESTYQMGNSPQIELVTSDFDDDFVKGVASMPEVRQAEGSRSLTARVQLADGHWDALTLQAIPDWDTMRILRPLLIEGETALGDGEAIIAKKTAERYHLAIGDTVPVELSDGTLREVHLIAIAQDLSGDPDSFIGSNLAYIAQDALDWYHAPPGWSTLRVTVAENPSDAEHLRAVAENITDRLERTGRVVYRTSFAKSLKHPLSYIITAMIGILGLLGVLVLFLSGTLITNTFSALLAQHMRQIGVIKLLGGRREQIIPLYLAMIAAYSLVALVITIPLAGWGALALSRMAANLINIVLDTGRAGGLTPLAVILQSVVALGIPLLTGLGPVLKGTRLSVQVALSGGDNLGNEEVAEGPLDRLMATMKAQSRPLLISLRNTFRRRDRLVLTLVTLMLGGSIFIAVFSSELALDNKVYELTRYFTADVNLELARNYRVDEISALALQVPGVVGVEAWSGASAEMLDDQDQVLDALSVVAPPAESALVTPIVLQGHWIRPDEPLTMAVNDGLVRAYPALGVGSTMRLRIDGREEDWTIVGVFQHMGDDRLLAYTDYAALSRWRHQPGQASSFRIVMATGGLENQQKMAGTLDQLYRDLGYAVNRSRAGDTYAAQTTDLLGVLTTVLLVMAMLTALVGSIGLAGTLSMNVMERTREIGVMRAIGAHNRIVARLVIVEGLLIGVLSYLLGVALSFPISALLSTIISRAIFGSAAEFAFSWRGVSIWLAVVLLLSVVASIMPARSASRLTIREVLAYE